MTSFGKQYAMNLNSGAGQGGWEQIEMENMLDPEDERENGLMKWSRLLPDLAFH
jgi:hypothetical protein